MHIHVLYIRNLPSLLYIVCLTNCALPPQGHEAMLAKEQETGSFSRIFGTFRLRLLNRIYMAISFSPPLRFLLYKFRALITPG